MYGIIKETWYVKSTMNITHSIFLFFTNPFSIMQENFILKNNTFITQTRNRVACSLESCIVLILNILSYKIAAKCIEC